MSRTLAFMILLLAAPVGARQRDIAPNHVRDAVIIQRKSVPIGSLHCDSTGTCVPIHAGNRYFIAYGDYVGELVPRGRDILSLRQVGDTVDLGPCLHRVPLICVDVGSKESKYEIVSAQHIKLFVPQIKADLQMLQDMRNLGVKLSTIDEKRIANLKKILDSVEARAAPQ